MARLSTLEVFRHLVAALEVIRVNCEAYNSGTEACWMPVATQLYKSLCTGDPNVPLVPKVFPNLKLAPLKNRLPKREVFQFLFAVPGLSFRNGKHYAERKILFDELGGKLPLDEWLDQVFLVNRAAGEIYDVTVGDLIVIMRHQEAAHVGQKPLGGRPKAIKDVLTIVEGSKKIKGFSKYIVAIGEYVLHELEI